jgi:hypothetical protein
MSDDFVSFKNNMTGVTIGTGTANPIGAPVLTPVFIGVRVVRSLVFFGRSLSFSFLLAIVLSVLLLLAVVLSVLLLLAIVLSVLLLLAIVLSVLLRLMDSDYLFGIFKDFLSYYFLASLSRKQDGKNI